MRRFPMPALRFLICYAALTACLYVWGSGYSAWLCRPVEIVLSALPVGAVAVDGVDLHETSDQRLFRMRAHTRETIATPRGDVPAGTPLQSTTLQAYAQHHVILIIAMLAAWPVRRGAERVSLLLAGVPAVALVTMLDMPFALLGVAQEAIVSAMRPQHAALADPIVLYFQFLQRGGRQVLSLVAAGLSIITVSALRRSAPAIPASNSDHRAVINERGQARL